MFVTFFAFVLLSKHTLIIYLYQNTPYVVFLRTNFHRKFVISIIKVFLDEIEN